MESRTHKLHSFQAVGDSDYTFENPDHDIRGFTVKDSAGEKIGRVDRLLIDVDARKVRFMEIGHGGFLGIGRDRSLLPVDAIESVDYSDHTVYITQTRERIGGSPAYQPDMVEKSDDYYASVYDYYGYPAYWSAGYAYPEYGAMRRERERPNPEYDKSKMD